MIKLNKNSAIPLVPDRHGNCKLTFETSDINFLYDLAPDDFNDEIENFSFDDLSYNHSNVKEVLINDQNGKCAFCEQNILSVTYGDVEHFRPKGGYSQNEIDNLNKPGYYWLASNWDNLLLVCQICNQRHKKNLFPLLNPEKRAVNHHSNLNLEKPYFINPYKENPIQLIGFNKEVAFGKDRRNRGKKTIESVGLNRSAKDKSYKDLLEVRRDYLELITQSHKISKKQPGGDLTEQDIDYASGIVKRAKLKTSRFSAMIIENCT